MTLHIGLQRLIDSYIASRNCSRGDPSRLDLAAVWGVCMCKKGAELHAEQHRSPVSPTACSCCKNLWHTVHLRTLQIFKEAEC